MRLRNGTLPALIFCVPAAVFAGQTVNLEVTSAKEVEKLDSSGIKKIVYVEPKSIVPGDVIRYSIRYQNAGAEPAEEIVITNPVPAHLEYLAGSAKNDDAIVLYSIDGGKSYDEAGNLFVLNPDGSKRLALPKEYTHIQWRLNHPVGAGDEGSVSYRARLE